MTFIFAVIGPLLLLAITAFCVFGFLATLEPTDTPGKFMAFRIGYAIVGRTSKVNAPGWLGHPFESKRWRGLESLGI